VGEGTRLPVPTGDRGAWNAQPGQVCLARPFDQLSDGGEPAVPGGGECAFRDGDQTGQR
jgi:hypothetical protein